MTFAAASVARQVLGDDVCFLVYGWLVDVAILDPPTQWVM